jgi:membrane associated rhomboid family serine protease
MSTNSTQSTGNIFSIIAITLGAVALMLFSVVCGAAAIVLALLANKKKENLSQIALVVAIGGAAVGAILGLVLGYRIFLI